MTVLGWLGPFVIPSRDVPFANRGQTVPLRWLALFRKFKEAREANWGQACLTYLYSSLDMPSRGTLCQLVGPWKLLEVNSLFYFFCISCISHSCNYFHPYVI